MRKLLNNPWVVGALALGAVAAVAHSVLSHDDAHGSAVADPAIAEATPSASGDSPQKARPALRARLDEIARLRSARDPFAFKLASAPARDAQKKTANDFTETVRVSAIWIQDGATYVLLDNRIVTIGDKVGRLTIDGATRDGIWVRHWKGRDFVAVGSEFTLVTPAGQAAALALGNDG